jgi:large subunit ribosomal protein L23
MNGSEYFDVLRKPILTEKATDLRDRHNHIAFEINPRANKRMVAEAIEKVFNVKVTGVRIMNTAGKPKKIGKFSGNRPGFKKALISLKEGDKVDIFERVE